MIDGDLWKEVRKGIPHPVHWTRIETGDVSEGVPDVNGCLNGVECWVELKATDAWAVSIRPMQIGWTERRIRSGGRVYMLTRRRHSGGPRKGPAIDELWIHHGRDMRHVLDLGLQRGPPPALQFGGGPACWDWDAVRRLLFAG